MTTRVTFVGHATFLIESGESRILIDPFLVDNPATELTPAAVQVDTILVTHGHGDHIADLVEVASNTNALVVSMVEISRWLGEKHGLTNLHEMNFGGTVQLPFGSVKMVPAVHTSGLPDGSYGGLPAGFVIRFPEGTVYFAGDTALFLDMELIARAGIDLAFLPIGDNYTMGPDDALEAVKILNPKRVVPCHYNTWPPIEQDPAAWAERVNEQTDTECIVLGSGQTIEL